MSEVAQETQPEFWRPPTPVVAHEVLLQPASAVMAEACPRCGTEYLMGSRFCHTCGGRRPAAVSTEAGSDAAAMAGLWQQAIGRLHSMVADFSLARSWRKIKFPAWLHYLHFHEIKSWVGLSTASLIAFVIGLACVAGALAVGLLNVRTFVDWQAIQFYRAEWLLAATAAFVAGILLKKSSRDGE